MSEIIPNTKGKDSVHRTRNNEVIFYQNVDETHLRNISFPIQFIHGILQVLTIEEKIQSTSLKSRNIYWEDWKYTSFVVFVCYSQNIRRNNAICRDELVADIVDKIGLKFQFSC